MLEFLSIGSHSSKSWCAKKENDGVEPFANNVLPPSFFIIPQLQRDPRLALGSKWRPDPWRTTLTLSRVTSFQWSLVVGQHGETVKTYSSQDVLKLPYLATKGILTPFWLFFIASGSSFAWNTVANCRNDACSCLNDAPSSGRARSNEKQPKWGQNPLGCQIRQL